MSYQFPRDNAPLTAIDEIFAILFDTKVQTVQEMSGKEIVRLGIKSIYDYEPAEAIDEVESDGFADPALIARARAELAP